MEPSCGNFDCLTGGDEGRQRFKCYKGGKSKAKSLSVPGQRGLYYAHPEGRAQRVKRRRPCLHLDAIHAKGPMTWTVRDPRRAPRQNDVMKRAGGQAPWSLTNKSWGYTKSKSNQRCA